MSNPFPTYPGFGLRVAYATKVIRDYGRDPLNTAYRERLQSRRFENCFEQFDGDALVYALMAKVFEQQDASLSNGIQTLGKTLWEDWCSHYWDVKNRQLALF